MTVENTHVRYNNFDLLRLFAAFQVFYFHACAHLLLKPGPLHAKLARVYSFFPGVPIFFVISGFLITLSWQRNQNLKTFYQNRFLRIYPAFWITFLLSLFFLLYSGFFNYTELTNSGFLTWACCHITGLAFILNSCFEPLGYATINGSVYTISAELHFYLILPFFLYVLKKIRLQFLYTATLFSIVICSSFFFHGLWHHQFGVTARTQWIFLGSVLPNMYLFIFGILFAQHLNKIKKLIENKVVYWFLLHTLLCFIVRDFSNGALRGNYITFLLCRITLAMFAISFAFSFRGLTSKIFRNFDISYSVYLFHGLIFHVFVILGMRRSWNYFWLSLLITISFATVSWFLIESPALKMKKWSLKQC